MHPPTRALVLAAVALLVAAPTVGAAAAAPGPPAATDPAAADAIDGGHTAAQQTSTVTLTVALTAPDGDPVRSAELTATWEGGSATATTAANGRAFLDVPAGATVEIAVDHPEYMRNSPYVVENASERTVDLTARRKGSATFRVVDGSGDPVPGASVVLRADGEVVVNGRTNDDGGFSTGTIERREYRLTVVEEGYYRVRRDLRVAETTAQEVTLERGSVTVSFEVVDDHFSPPEPVSEARIDLESVGTFTTLRNGEATAQVPVNADLQLSVTKEGYGTTTRTLQVGESPTTVNLSVSRTPELRLTTANERVVVGERTTVTVVDEYGAPVPDATVRVDGEAVGTTGGDGTLRVRLESAGNRTIVAETADLTSAEVTVEAVRERTATPTATPEPTPTATATATVAADESQSGISVPGFGPAAVLAAVLALAALLATRAGGPEE